MDYSKMSDQEINVAIAGIFHPDSVVIESKSRPSCACITGHLPILWFDYCNNPADAWPIIVANKINIEFEGDVINGKEEWWSIASWGRTATEHQFHTDDNPLRAAMVVFLMVQESRP